MKKGLVLGIIALFIISAVSPMVIGYNAVKSERDEFLDGLAFYCLDASGSNAKYEYYKEQLQNVVIDEIEKDVLQPVKTSPSNIQSGGPMEHRHLN